MMVWHFDDEAEAQPADWLDDTGRWLGAAATLWLLLAGLVTAVYALACAMGG